jgi:acetolactate synthase I/II/III large subunit
MRNDFAVFNLPCSKRMNGAESLVHTLIDSGVDTCFANPGTSEMHFVAALDRIPGIKCIPGLQENVVTGMADGYGRIARKPALTLLHCGGGLSNGIANLLNARKAQSPIVNVVGDQATYHSKFDPPLASDVEALARASSHWVRTSSTASAVGRDGAAAVQAARTSPGQVATLVLPSDASWSEGGEVASALPVPVQPQVDAHAIAGAARLLREKSNVLLLLGAEALREESQIEAQRIVAKTGCSVMAVSICGLTQRGRGRMALQRVPFATDAAIAALAKFEHVILVGTKGAVGFFAYPGKANIHTRDGANIHVLARVEQDPVAALAAVADALSAPRVEMPSGARPDLPKGIASSASFGRMLGAIMPEHAVVVDESITFGLDLWTHSAAAAPHDWMMVTGGAIGFGMPCATGAAVAGKGRRVINLQADGSAMYTIQSLWTQAREKLPVTTVILSNRKYQILMAEYANVGANPGRTALDMLDLGNPDLDFVKMAAGMGVEGAKASTLEECAVLMQVSLRRNEPFLVELAI